MIVGAYALSAYIKPRSTGDIDFFIDRTPKNAIKVLASIQEFGAPVLDITEKDFEEPGTIYQIGLPPFRIDIINRISGVTFEEAWSQRQEHNILHIKVPILSKNHLIQNKKASARPKDLLDVIELEKT